MPVLQRRHVRWTHRAFISLPADAGAVAKLNGGGKPAFSRKIVMSIDCDRAVLGAVAEVLGHRRRVHDLARVHPVIRIECGADLPECPIQLRTKELLVQMTARKSVSVFTAHAAAKFND